LYEEKITSLRKNALETLIEDEKRFFVNPTAAWKDVLTQSRMNGEYTEMQDQCASAKVRQMTKRHERAEQDENKTCQELDEYKAQVSRQRGKKYEDTRVTDEEQKRCARRRVKIVILLGGFLTEFPIYYMLTLFPDIPASSEPCATQFAMTHCRLELCKHANAIS